MASQVNYGPEDAIAIPAQYEVPVTGFSITPRNSLLVLNPAGTLANGTLLLPENPLDGQRQGLSTTEQITAFTVTAASGDSVDNAPTELAAGAAFELCYVKSERTWFPSSAAPTAPA